MTPNPERVPSQVAQLRRFAEETPTAPAVSAGTDTLTYAELWALVTTRSAGMRMRGVRAGDLVGMCMKRGIQPLVTAWSAWALGAAWVFLDNDHPVARLQTIVDGSLLGWVVADETSADLERVVTLPLDQIDAEGARDRSHVVDVDLCADTDLAYLIYTSGSTGVPKGVSVEHRSLRFFLDAFGRAVLSSPEGAVWIAGAALSFDMCIPESIGALTWGGHVVVRRRLEAAAPLIRRHRGTHLQCTPTQLALFLADPEEREALLDLRHLIVAGEQLPVSLASEVRSAFSGRFTNVYGPTEITVYATGHEIESPPTEQVPIGRPYPGVTCAVVDPESLVVLPEGMRGELVIAGPGVSRGYHRRDDLTSRAFVPLPIGPHGESLRAYRSGDLAEIRTDGTIYMFGRIDHQVKVRGQRIELGEIESILAGHPSVRLAATVVVRVDGPADDARLVSHIVSATGSTADPEVLRAWCRERLPEFMVPAFVVVHSELPYTATGKIDRSALAALGLPVATDPIPVGTGPGESVASALGRMTALWEGVLKVRVGPDDNFFGVGGHSLLGVELLIRLRESFGRQLPLGSLITSGTPRSMLAVLESGVPVHRCLQQLRTGSGPATVIVHGAGGYLLRLYALAQKITPGRPVYGLQAHGLQPGESPDAGVGQMATRYLGDLALEKLVDRELGVLIGYSGGGLIAWEMGARIGALGGAVPAVIALDTDIPRQAGMSRPMYWKNLSVNIATGGLPVLRAWWRIRKRRSVEQLRRDALLAEAAEHGFADIQSPLERVIGAYRPGPAPVPFGLVRVTEESPSERPDFGWRELVRGRYAERTVEGNHYSILEEPLLDGLSSAIAEILGELSDTRTPAAAG